MAYIVEPAVSNRALLLGKEEYIRPLPFGSNWSRIMVSIWWYIPYASNFSGNITLGFCQGQTGGYQSPTADALITAPGSTSGDKTYTYNASPPAFVVGGGGSAAAISQNYFGSKTELTGAMTTNPYVSADSNNPSLLAFLVYRGSPGTPYITVNVAAPGSAATTTPYPPRWNRLWAAEFERVFSPGSSVEIPYGSVVRSYSSMTCVGGPFLYDSVCVSWSNAAVPIVISDLYVVRFSV